MSSPIVDLAERAAKPARLVVGLISGTSADAIDVAVCRFEGDRPRIELVVYHEHPHDPEVKRWLFEAAGLGIRRLAELNIKVGEAFAAACLITLAEAGIAADQVDYIGSHGQTVYHHSGMPGAKRATLQMGDGDVIAVATGLCVVSDFRARDIAAGGEGAPLSPIADAVMFASSQGEPRRAILNLGGIANLTILDAQLGCIGGFDLGPANAPLDRLAQPLSGGVLDCDQDGRFARAGVINRPLLESLLAEDAFLARRPPKSTGFEMYGDAFVEETAARHGGFDNDLMATLVEFVARAVARGLEWCADLDPPVGEVVAAGGGVRNGFLLERIAAAIDPVPLRISDELGVPADAREAIAFALLADMTLRGKTAPLPAITGARAPKVLGKISFP